MSWDPRAQHSGTTCGIAALKRKATFKNSIYRGNNISEEDATRIYVGDALWQEVGEVTHAKSRKNMVPIRCDFNGETAYNKGQLPQNRDTYSAWLERAALAGKVRTIGRANAATKGATNNQSVMSEPSISTQGVMNVNASVHDWDGQRAYVVPGDHVYLVPPPVNVDDTGVSRDPIASYDNMAGRHMPCLMPGGAASNYRNEASCAADRYLYLLECAGNTKASNLPENPHLTQFCSTLLGGWVDITAGAGPIPVGLALTSTCGTLVEELARIGRETVEMPFHVFGIQYVLNLEHNTLAISIGDNRMEDVEGVPAFIEAIANTLRNLPSAGDAGVLYKRTFAAVQIMLHTAEFIKKLNSTAAHTQLYLHSVPPDNAIPYGARVSRELRKRLISQGGNVITQWIDRQIASGLGTSLMLAPAYFGQVVQTDGAESGVVVVARP